MVGLTAVMVIEKTTAWGSGLVVPLGAALLAAAAATAAEAVVLPAGHDQGLVGLVVAAVVAVALLPAWAGTST
jgi:hypothetical protein